MTITIPNNNIKERKYILEIMFNEFLGLDYKICIEDHCSSWIIELENNNTLIIEDHFFSKFPSNLEYLNINNLPIQIKYTANKFITENDIPIIYGSSSLNILDKSVICGMDIFASCFFMLTRWEEYVNKNRDEHNRFSAFDSVSFKNGFLDRAIVNEYLELLKNMLLYLGHNSGFKKKNYQLYLTHDVDHIGKWDTKIKFFKHLAGDIVHRKSLTEFLKSIKNYMKLQVGFGKDPYDTFDYLMDISDKHNLKSHFFFMAEGLSLYDNNYKVNSNNSLNIINKIKKRGHLLGIHPTYNAYNNSSQFTKEKKELVTCLESDILFGREHYLRFEIPHTWQIWDDNNMLWDSTCGYSDKEGFRSGVCYEYSVFNILTQKKLKLKEYPLIAMDGTFLLQKNMSPKRMINAIKDLMIKTKKYNGNFVFLWHNSSFNTPYWNQYNHVYESVLNDNK